MRRLLVIGAIVVVAAGVGVAIAIAATGGSGSGAKTGGGTVSVQKIAGAGTVLVDSQGRPLYRSDQEKGGMARCTGACLSFWRPLVVKGTPKATSLPGNLGVVTRPDGGRQVTFDGKLLYSFKLDGQGQVKGDGFRDEFDGQKFHWHVVRPAGASSSSSPKPASTPTYPGY